MSEGPVAGKRDGQGRFRKGSSGNTRGRPLARKPPDSAFDIILDKTLTLSQGGVAQEVAVDAALQHRTYEKAIAGDNAAQKEVMKWIVRREEWLQTHQRAKPTSRVVERIIEPTDPANADSAMVLLGIAIADPYWGEKVPELRLLLNAWAVQAALTRRRGGSLSPLPDQAGLGGAQQGAAADDRRGRTSSSCAVVPGRWWGPSNCYFHRPAWERSERGGAATHGDKARSLSRRRAVDAGAMDCRSGSGAPRITAFHQGAEDGGGGHSHAVQGAMA